MLVGTIARGLQAPRRTPKGSTRGGWPLPLGALAGLALGLAGCAPSERPPAPAEAPPEAPGQAPASTQASGADAPYRVNGTWYYPRASAEGYREMGLASWYGRKFHGQRTASGDIYDMHSATAAHRTLPLPTWARVTNLENGRSTRVRINDRGPFVDTDERIIDLSFAAAQRLGIDETGLGRVRVVALEGPSISTTSFSPDEGPSGDDTKWHGVRSAEGPLYLQVGAFHREDNAAQLKERLQALDLERVVIAMGRYQGQPVYRVRIGPLSDVATADRLVRRLGRQGLPTGELVRE